MTESVTKTKIGRLIFIVIALMFFTLACVSEAAMPLQSGVQGAGAAVSASEAAQAMGVGVVAASGNDIQGLIEGDTVEDWKSYVKAKSLQQAKWCVRDLRELNDDVGDCTAYYCDDVQEIMVVCSLKSTDDVVVFTYANSAGCFTWEKVSRMVTDGYRNIRGCVYIDTL